MKLLVVIVGLFVICSGKSLPDELPPLYGKGLPDELPPLDNSHYVEGQSRYVWMMPDNEPVLVDLEETADEELLKTRNGANNRYLLFTRSNPSSSQTLTNGNVASVSNSNFVASRPTMVIVHGWNNNANSPMNANIRDAFLRVHNGNVIVVDWSALASSSYATAVAGAPSVGQFLGNFLGWLYRSASSGGNFNNVHLVGFSLGAHIVGIAGRTVGTGVVSRVTGLDPAGPNWLNNPNRLSTNSARYVECIHTEGTFLGIGAAIGHVDFFPNGGRSQPGCGTANTSCSHGRATEFFASSVQNNHLVGRRCTNVAQATSGSCTGAILNMGNAVINKSGTGIYHVTTTNSWPF